MRRFSPLLTAALAVAALAAAGCTTAPHPGPVPGGGSARRTVAPGRPSPLLTPRPLRADVAERPGRRPAPRWEHVAIG
ncbi:hypothetical protein ACFU7T_04940 [Streptomyces sp. NPDC057555]|uniref:hypothetical protein n=1 Tax=Streptomyces sp. NPDC057555 TaxID=3346166 RepID=UPI0036874094